MMGNHDAFLRTQFKPCVMTRREWDEFLASQSSGCSSKPVFADLSQGSWVPRQASNELAKQLKISLERMAIDEEHPECNSTLLSYSRMIAKGIDSEAKGDLAIRLAYQDAEAIAQEAVRQGRSIFVITPPSLLFLDSYDLYLLYFIEKKLPADVAPFKFITFAHLGTQKCSHSDTYDVLSMAVCLPGLLSEQILRQTGECIERHLLPLDSGLYLVSPYLRRDPSVMSRNDYDKLTTHLQEFPWLRAFAMFHGNNLFVNSLELCDRAAEAHGHGSSALALRLLERASNCAKTPLERGICQARAQGIRIASHRFDELAALPEPSPSLPSELYAFLLQTRSWGMVMMGDIESAERSFSMPLKTLHKKDQLTPEDLYLLNIYALAQLRQGRHDEALTIEQMIATEHACLPDKDYQLQYINNINLARLYRRHGSLAQSSRHYQKAFETSNGARSPMENLHWNVIQASMANARGEHDNAKRCWFRAALHWLVIPAPEGLNPRIVQAILGRQVQPMEDHVAAIDEALIAHLALEAFRLMDIPCFEFKPVEEASQALSLACGGSGWGVLASSHESGDSLLLTPQRMKLQTYVTHRLLTACPVLAEIGVRVIAIDDCHGSEVPGNIHQLLLCALKHGISMLAYENRMFIIKPQEAELLLRATIVSMNPAIASIALDAKPHQARFKRHLSPRLLCESDIAFLRLIRVPRSAEEVAQKLGKSMDSIWRLILQLCNKRLVSLSLPKDACIAVGIS